MRGKSSRVSTVKFVDQENFTYMLHLTTQKQLEQDAAQT